MADHTNSLSSLDGRSEEPANKATSDVQASEGTDSVHEEVFGHQNGKGKALKSGSSEYVDDETARLKDLAAVAKDQDELEKDIGRQADQMLQEQADERDQKRLEKTIAQKEKLATQVRKLQQRLNQPMGTASSTRIRAEIEHLQPQIDALDRDLAQIQQRMEDRHNDGDGSNEQTGNKRMPGESQREFLIRTGKITPFSKFGTASLRTSSSLADAMLDAEEEQDIEQEAVADGQPEGNEKVMSHRHLLKPGYLDESASSDTFTDPVAGRTRKKRKVQDGDEESDVVGRYVDSSEARSGEEYVDGENADESVPDLSESESEMGVVVGGTDTSHQRPRKRKPARRKGRSNISDDAVEDLTGVDDGDEQLYQQRLERWVLGRKETRRKAQRRATIGSSRQDGEADSDTDIDLLIDDTTEPAEEEWYLPHPTRADAEFDGGFRIPGDIYPSLFDYQKTGVQWLCELYTQQVGGIVGDEMGLGKTIQIIAFLAGLHYSKKLKKPIVVVTPSTVMKQWVNEFHRWWPPLRVSILHSSGSGMMNVGREKRIEDELETRAWGSTSGHKKASKSARKIVDRAVRDGHVLVTTYFGLQSFAELLIPVDWEYAILDEGHMIRNPNTAITIYCKELRTANRIILSGTPMQNNLTELWSLFDFIFPMRLGTLVNFRTQFEFPIKQGGYANASNLQVETALKCAETLKDAISPYLLQRFKIDVAADLPKKTEQVLFCKLTKLQREAYESFLGSEEMKSIMDGKRQVLYGIDMLRKVCNHPDLTEHRTLSLKPNYNYGVGSKSGKMQVVKALLQLWRDTGHKTLLFAQHRIMLDILEKFIKSLGGFNYRRMDGNTQIKDRQDMVDEFNNHTNLHVFLLTTKVGGLGVNLTGADRVIIYDPDWNPSTDVQARERAWRLGQKREVMIYRLMTAGTIEEKIYHRQIFKQILINKILRDPKQRQTFQLKDLHDLFTLGDSSDDQTETSGLFKGTEVRFNEAADAVIQDADASRGLPTPPTESDDPSKISSITGVSRREAFQTAEDDIPIKDTPPVGTLDGTDAKPSINSSSRVLSTIFARTGVHSALEHDAIISSGSARGSGKVTADPAIIAREARKVAAHAARELQRASETARTVPVGTPTWTGTYGIAGRPEEPTPQTVSPLALAHGRGRGRGIGRGRGGGGGGGGPASSTVLSNLASRLGGERSTPERQQAHAHAHAHGRDFLELIRDFFVAHGGRCYTQMLVDHFDRLCRDERRTAEFKEMLRVIAVLDRRGGRGGRGLWVLKGEFGGEG